MAGLRHEAYSPYQWQPLRRSFSDGLRIRHKFILMAATEQNVFFGNTFHWSAYLGWGTRSLKLEANEQSVSTGDTAAALWFEAKENCRLRHEPLGNPAQDKVLVRTLYSGISRGTEALIFNVRLRSPTDRHGAQSGGDHGGFR